MSLETGTSDRERAWTYWVALGLLILLVLIGLISFSAARETTRANEMADEFIATLQSEGLTAPSKDQVVRVLGDDGRGLCDDPGGSLRRSISNMQLMNGAAGPGMRPTLTDAARLLKGQLIAIRVYCPDEVEEFQKYLDDLKSEHTLKG